MTSAMLLAGQAAAGEAELDALARALDEHEGCTARTEPEAFDLDVDFWGNVVSHQPYTLIGDTDHRKPHLMAYMGNAEIIDRWAQHGVTDVYLEVEHDDVWPQLEPYMSVDTFDEVTVKRVFMDYIEERGFYDVGDWGERRAEYVSAFFGHALRNDIHFHFISQDVTYSDYFDISSQEEDRLAGMDGLYRLFTRALSADCSLNGGMKDGFLRALDDDMSEEYKDYKKILFKSRILSDRERAETIKKTNHGGRVVVIFGSGHFTIKHPSGQDFNMREHLGAENTFYVEPHMRDGFGVRYRIESDNIDAFYFMRDGKAEYVDENTLKYSKPILPVLPPHK